MWTTVRPTPWEMIVHRDGIRGDDGFTMVELLIVVLIIGILIAIGLPTYLGARSRAQDVHELEFGWGEMTRRWFFGSHVLTN